MKARENPFAMHHVERLRYRLEDIDWGWIDRRFEALGRRGAVVGPHGSGKSTLVRELVRRWSAAGWSVRMLRLSEDAPQFASGVLEGRLARITGRDIIVLDGAEQLSWWGWRQFLRKTRQAGGLLITVHRPARLPTILECRTSPRLLEALIHDLVPGCGLPAGVGLRDLFDRHHGNLRDAIRELYDQFAARSA